MTLYLKIDHLTKYYQKKKGIEDVNLEIKKGEIFGFIGPNGSGKSTTIKCILNFLNSQSGAIFIKEKKVTKDDIKEKENIGYLPSEIHLYEDLTVKEMLDFAETFYKKNHQKKRNDLVKKLAVDETKKINELSLGNLKKVGIILALFHNPEFIILDEPTSGLDPIMQQVFYDIIKEEKKMGHTCFYSTHVLNEVSLICDRFGIIKNGSVIKIENVDDLKKNDLKIVTIESNSIKELKTQLHIKPMEENKNYIKFLYNRDINELIKIIAKYQIETICIENPSVEDIFMHYYQ